MNGSKRYRLLLVLLLIVVALGGYGSYWWFQLRGTVSTDDAYVDARIVTVSSRLLGRVQSVEVDEGDTVKKGQVLLVLDPVKWAMAVAHERAVVARAQATLDRLSGPRQEEIDVGKAEIEVLKVEVVKKAADYSRGKRLARVKAISAAELDRLKSEVDLAQAALEVKRQNFKLLLAGGSQDQKAEATAEYEMAFALMESAKADLADGVIYSPVEGVVAKRTVDAGEVVSAGTGLFQVVENSRTWIVANLEEQDIAELREGQSVQIYLDAYPGQKLSGRVGPVYGATLSRFSLLSTSSASGNFIKVTQRVPVRIEWEGEHNLSVVPGLNAVVRIQLNHHDYGPPTVEAPTTQHATGDQ